MPVGRLDEEDGVGPLDGKPLVVEQDDAVAVLVDDFADGRVCFVEGGGVFGWWEVRDGVDEDGGVGGGGAPEVGGVVRGGGGD